MPHEFEIYKKCMEGCTKTRIITATDYSKMK